MTAYFEVEPAALHTAATTLPDVAGSVRTAGSRVTTAAGTAAGAAGDGPLATALHRFGAACTDGAEEAIEALDLTGATLTTSATSYTETDLNALLLR